MRRIILLLPCLCSLMILSACSDVQLQQAQPADPSVTKDRVKDSWLNSGDSTSAKLDENLLRKNIYLVLDCSSSMNDSCGNGRSKLEVAKAAISRFVSLVPEDTNIGLLTFERSDPQEKIPLGTKNRKEIIQAVDQTKPEGGTPLSKAVEAGYQKLREQAMRQLGYGEYHLVVITDGEANPGYDPTPIVNHVLSTSPVVIHTIGLMIGQGHSLNQQGRTIYKDARNPQDLEDGLKEIAAESEQF
jgi:Ca-activated chloride channel homolog